MEEQNTLKPYYYLEYDNLKGMVIHSKPFSHFFLILRRYSIFSLFCQYLQETDLEERDTMEHCGEE